VAICRQAAGRTFLVLKKFRGNERKLFFTFVNALHLHTEKDKEILFYAAKMKKGRRWNRQDFPSKVIT